MLTNIQELDQDDLATIMRYNIRRGGNLMVFGEAGTGKTEMGYQAIEEAGFQPCYLNLSVMEAPDLQGLPYRDNDNQTDYAPPKKLPLFSSEKKIILMLDELDKADPSLQNPCLELLQFRSINGRKLNIHGVLATGNRPDEGSFSKPISHALMNRCSVYTNRCNPEVWTQWAAGKVNPLIVGYISKHPDRLLMRPAGGDDTAYAHESPRSWTMAGADMDLATEDESRNIEFMRTLVAGRVGSASSIDFQTWLVHYREIEPFVDALVQRGVHPTEHMSLDKVFVMAIAGANAVMAACRKDNKNNVVASKETHQVTANVMGWMKDLGPDVTVGACKSTFDPDLVFKHKLTSVPDFMTTYVQIRKAMKA